MNKRCIETLCLLELPRLSLIVLLRSNIRHNCIQISGHLGYVPGHLIGIQKGTTKQKRLQQYIQKFLELTYVLIIEKL